MTVTSLDSDDLDLPGRDDDALRVVTRDLPIVLPGQTIECVDGSLLNILKVASVVLPFGQPSNDVEANVTTPRRMPGVLFFELPAPGIALRQVKLSIEFDELPLAGHADVGDDPIVDHP